MKKRFVRFLLGTLYVVLLTALLITHTRKISGELERTMALAETLLLAVPAVIILVLYVRMKESEEDKDVPGKKEEAPPGMPGVSEIMSLEQLKERIITLEQLQGRTTISEQPVKGGGFVLTEREWEIAWLIYCGYSNRQIAEEYFIAESTVKKHTSHIYEKLQVSGRKEFREKY